MSGEESVRRAKAIAQITWVVFNAIITITLLEVLSGWWLLLIPVIAIVTLLLVPTLAGAVLLSSPSTDPALDEEDVRELAESFDALSKQARAGDPVAKEELLELMRTLGFDQMSNFITVVVATSDEKVGRFQDKDIFEWIGVLNPRTGDTDRYLFYGVTESDSEGEALVPDIDGAESFANFNGITYYLPAQSST